MFNGDSRTAEKFVVRMPRGMRERIAGMANNNHRSMNSEIILRLEESIAVDGEGVAAIEGDKLSKEEKAIVQAARNLSASKRKALLSLLASER